MEDDTVNLTVDETVRSLGVNEELLEATAEEYLADETERTPDVGGFLAFLRTRGVIEPEQYLIATESRPIEVGLQETLPASESGRFRPMGAIGAGGMAEIQVARDEVLERNVAVKILHPQRLTNPRSVKRFIQEAKVTGKLDHPNIVPVHALFADEAGRMSFAMKLVNGRTLGELLDTVRAAYEMGGPMEEQLSLRGRLDVFVRICDAMEYAHQKGVVHRDLKPANLMVGNFGEVYVMDWGIAKVLKNPELDAGSTEEIKQALGIEFSDEFFVGATQEGTVIGTPSYMSPEQGRGLEIDARSDVYSLGAILYELVTLQKMLPGKATTEILTKLLTGHRPTYAHFHPGERVDPVLRAIIERATHDAPNQRYQSAHQLAAEVRRFLADQETEALPDRGLRRLLRWMGHHRELTLVIVMGVTTFLAGLTIAALIKQNRTVVESQLREREFSRLQTHTSERAHAIDSQFVRFEVLAKGLAAQAAIALDQRSPKSTRTLHDSREFDSDTPPSTAFEAKVYGKKIALDGPCFKLAPGVEYESVAPKLERAAELTTTFQRTFLESRVERSPVEGFEALQKTIGTQGVPARWSYVGLAEGVMISFPAKGGYPPEYDARKRPWYKLGDKAREPVWGAAYPDLQGQGIVLPTVTGVWGDDGTYYGVAGIEVTFEYIIGTFMAPTQAVSQTYLVDGDGKIVVNSTHLGLQYAPGDLHGALKQDDFPFPEVAEKMRKGLSGVHPIGKKELLSFQRIPTLGWYLVERAATEKVLAGEE